MEYIVVIIFFIVLLIIVGRMAKNRNRIIIGWVILSFFISPLIVMIILYGIGNNYKQIYEELEKNIQI